MTASTFESLTGAVDLDFPEYAAPPTEPMALVGEWLRSATEHGVREPRALALATADDRGRVSSRTVAILDVTERGLTFATHTCSRKGRDLAVNAWASGLLYWRETGRQLVLSGPTRPLPWDKADQVWRARPTPLHSMSVASRQSEPLDDPIALLTKADRLAEPGTALPKPDRFVCYEIAAAEVEFWCASSDRLHRRLSYERHGDGWLVHRLQP